jgi:hypothetical protein
VPSIYGSISANTEAFDTYRTAYTGFKQTASDEERSARTLGTGVSWLANRFDDLISVRYVLAERAQSRYTASSTLRSIPADGPARATVRLLTIGDEVRLALCQRAGETSRFQAVLLPVDLLYFSMGLDGGVGATGDSIFFSLMLQNDLGCVDYRKGFDLKADGGRWHDARLDISSINGRLTEVTATIAGRTSGGGGVVGGWGDLEFATADCPVVESDGGYRIALAAPGRCFSLRLRTSARELPLDIVLGDGSFTKRIFAFPPKMKSRQVRIDLDEPAENLVLIRSDSTFEIGNCRQVPREWGTDLDCALLYDGDMCIYENSRAVAKGICLDAAKLARTNRDGGPMVALAALEDVRSAECGRSRIVSYRPEEIVLEVSTDRPSVLVFQDMMYPGWRAYVDGVESELLATDLGIRAMELDNGNHRVRMVFRPGGLRLGVGLTLLGAVLTAAYAVRPRWLARLTSHRASGNHPAPPARKPGSPGR